MCAWRWSTPPADMPFIIFLLVIAGLLWCAEWCFGVPGLCRYGMAAVLAFCGTCVGVANWCILMNNLRGKKWASSVPLVGPILLLLAVMLSGYEGWGFLVIIIDPWLVSLPLGLLWWLLRRWR